MLSKDSHITSPGDLFMDYMHETVKAMFSHQHTPDTHFP